MLSRAHQFLEYFSPLLTFIGTIASLIAVYKVWNINKKIYASHELKNLHENITTYDDFLKRFINCLNKGSVSKNDIHQLRSFLYEIQNQYSFVKKDEELYQAIEQSTPVLTTERSYELSDPEITSLQKNLHIIKAKLNKEVIPSEK